MNALPARQWLLAGAIATGLFSTNAIAALPDFPISLDAANGKTAPTVEPMDECPFLSDKTALAGVKGGVRIDRQSVSNTKCVWNKGLGFSLVVQVEPAAGARPFAERHYNMDGKTQVDELPGPGKEAVLLSHTSWGKPIAYALGFKQGEHAVFIKATGLRTNAAMLQPVADEVASRLPKAPKIAEQQRKTTPAYQNCSTWDKNSLLALLELPADTKSGVIQGNTYCNYEFGNKGQAGHEYQASVSFSTLRKSNWKKQIDKYGAKTVDGFKYPVLSRSFEDKWGKVWTLMADVNGTQATVSVTDRKGNDRAGQTRALMENLLKRLQ